MKYIELTRGQRAIVDDADYDRISQFKWSASRSRTKSGVVWYANHYYRHPTARDKLGHRKNTMISMHRMIMNAPRHLQVDHADGNPLDNRKCNLRLCACAQNLWNQRWFATPDKPYKGVYKYKSKKHPGWRVTISINKVAVELGWFKSAEVAAHTYDKLATAFFGEYARLNFPAKKIG